MSVPATECKQPAILTIAFLIEMWERYGFYIAQGILVLYMTGIYHFSDSKSYSILGAFTALAYLTPLIGGYVANRMIGFRHSITLGGLLLMLGYATLALPSNYAFYFGLAIIASGNGLFKPNVSSYVGTFYNKEDTRREQGFTYFYMGINVGSLLSFLTSGYIVRYFGWDHTFITAAVGLFIGVCTFVIGTHYLKKRGKLNPVKTESIVKYASLKNIIMVYAGLVVLIVLIEQLLDHTHLANILLAVSGLVAVVGMLYLAFRSEKAYRHHMYACIALMLMSVLYWAFNFQMYFSLTLFNQRIVDRHIFGLLVPAPVFTVLEAVFILVFGAILGSIWKRLEANNTNPLPATKFTFGFYIMLVALLLYIASLHTLNHSHFVVAAWLILTYAFIALSELLIQPIGIATITYLSPPKLVGFMMGAWLMTLAFGGKLAGVLAHLADVPKHASLQHAELIYSHAFEYFAVFCLVAGIIMTILAPTINRYTEEGHKHKH